jgi:hypothetical protein
MKSPSYIDTLFIRCVFCVLVLFEVAVCCTNERGSHVVDGQFLQLANSGSKAEVLENCVGTLHLSRKDVPQTVKDKNLRKGTLVAQHSGPVSILKWKDKKEVTI